MTRSIGKELFDAISDEVVRQIHREIDKWEAEVVREFVRVVDDVMADEYGEGRTYTHIAVNRNLFGTLRKIDSSTLCGDGILVSSLITPVGVLKMESSDDLAAYEFELSNHKRSRFTWKPPYYKSKGNRNA